MTHFARIAVVIGIAAVVRVETDVDAQHRLERRRLAKKAAVTIA